MFYFYTCIHTIFRFSQNRDIKSNYTFYVTQFNFSMKHLSYNDKNYSNIRRITMFQTVLFGNRCHVFKGIFNITFCDCCKTQSLVTIYSCNIYPASAKILGKDQYTKINLVAL